MPAVAVLPGAGSCYNWGEAIASGADPAGEGFVRYVQLILCRQVGVGSREIGVLPVPCLFF